MNTRSVHAIGRHESGTRPGQCVPTVKEGSHRGEGTDTMGEERTETVNRASEQGLLLMVAVIVLLGLAGILAISGL